MKDAAAASVDGSRDISIGLDGRRQKRGYVSLNVMTTATNVEAGHVVDKEVISKYFVCPRELQMTHEADWKARYICTSGDPGKLYLLGNKQSIT